MRVYCCINVEPGGRHARQPTEAEVRLAVEVAFADPDQGWRVVDCARVAAPPANPRQHGGRSWEEHCRLANEPEGRTTGLHRDSMG